jgi:hypothetical protein
MSCMACRGKLSSTLVKGTATAMHATTVNNNSSSMAGMSICYWFWQCTEKASLLIESGWWMVDGSGVLGVVGCSLIPSLLVFTSTASPNPNPSYLHPNYPRINQPPSTPTERCNGNRCRATEGYEHDGSTANGCEYLQHCRTVVVCVVVLIR